MNKENPPDQFMIKSLDGVVKGTTTSIETTLKYIADNNFIVIHLDTGIIFCGGSLTTSKLFRIIQDVKRIQEAESSKVKSTNSADLNVGVVPKVCHSNGMCNSGLSHCNYPNCNCLNWC